MKDIIIDIQNNPDILDVIQETIPYMEGWKAMENTKPGNTNWKDYPNKTARYFAFDFKAKEFQWAAYDYARVPEAVKIRNVSQISQLLDQIYEKSKRKLPQRVVIDIQNNPIVLDAIIKTLNQLGGWEVSFNALPDNVHWTKYPNGTARYFLFDLQPQIFRWKTSDETPPQVSIKIRNVNQALKLIQKINMMITPSKRSQR